MFLVNYWLSYAYEYHTLSSINIILILFLLPRILWLGLYIRWPMYQQLPLMIADIINNVINSAIIHHVINLFQNYFVWFNSFIYMYNLLIVYVFKKVGLIIVFFCHIIENQKNKSKNLFDPSSIDKNTSKNRLIDRRAGAPKSYNLKIDYSACALARQNHTI